LGCRWLLAEDFQHARRYGSVQIVNPFRTEPNALTPREAGMRQRHAVALPEITAA